VVWVGAACMHVSGSVVWVGAACVHGPGSVVWVGAACVHGRPQAAYRRPPGGLLAAPACMQLSETAPLKCGRLSASNRQECLSGQGRSSTSAFS
jgi:hypothetical protein